MAEIKDEAKVVAVAINSKNNTACIVKSLSSFDELKDMWSMRSKEIIPTGWGGCMPLDDLVKSEGLKLNKKEFHKEGEIAGRDDDHGKKTEWTFKYDTIRSAKLLKNGEEKEKTESKPKELTQFEKTIKAYLEDFANKDASFKACLEKPKKSIQECCKYICGEVRRMNVQVLDDGEVFYLARHYYQEDDIEASDGGSCQVVISKQLTDEEKKAAHDRAVKQFESDELMKLKDKAQKQVQEDKNETHKIAQETLDRERAEIAKQAVDDYKKEQQAKAEAKKKQKAKLEAEKKAAREKEKEEQTTLFDFL